MESDPGFRFEVFGLRKLWREFSVFSFQCSANRSDGQSPTPALTFVFDPPPLHSFEISNLKSQIRAAAGGQR